VHRGKIVVDERITVYRLDRDRKRDDVFGATSGKFRAEKTKRGTKSLTSAESGVFHRRKQRLGRAASVKNGGKFGLEVFGTASEKFFHSASASNFSNESDSSSPFSLFTLPFICVSLSAHC